MQTCEFHHQDSTTPLTFFSKSFTSFDDEDAKGWSDLGIYSRDPSESCVAKEDSSSIASTQTSISKHAYLYSSSEDEGKEDDQFVLVDNKDILRVLLDRHFRVTGSKSKLFDAFLSSTLDSTALRLEKRGEYYEYDSDGDGDDEDDACSYSTEDSILVTKKRRQRQIMLAVDKRNCPDE